MTTLLISDLHIEPGKPHLTAVLLKFLSGPARQADALYLLGDIFHVWVGDDDRSRFVQSIEAALKAVVDSGVPVYFMVGNRDFLVKDGFAQRAGVTLIDDPTVALIGGVKTLLTHGDRYCTDDAKYQAFRVKSRSYDWQKKILRLPLFLRRVIAGYGRWKSRTTQAKAMSAGYISDVVDTAVVGEMQQLGVKRLVHGHTHRPAEHAVALGNERGERIVLADWREEGEALEIRDDGSFVRMRLTA
jgi:UDP-2,3-diacylglucosamine hydrolase